MKAGLRFVIIAICSAVIMLIRAFVGVNYPIIASSWLSKADSLFIIALIGGLIWAVHPVAVRIKRRVVRYLLYASAVIILTLIFTFLSFVLMVMFWFEFGGNK